jgi:hypothetical protein
MKKTIKLTESDLSKIVRRIINEQSSSESKKKFIISQNNEKVKYIKNKYLSQSDIDGTIRGIIKSAVEKFGKKVNADASKVVNQMLNSNGYETASLYLEAVKNSIYDTVNDIGWAEKALLNKLVTKNEFIKLMDKNSGVINDLLTSLTINNFLEMHDMKKSNEVRWYDTAYDGANSRIEGVRKHLVEWITKQLFG